MDDFNGVFSAVSCMEHGVMRISAVITCCNLERYIGEAIESVLAQDIGEAVEVIVVDDASTDRSRAVAAGYPAVKLLEAAENGGVLLAMLRGLDAARGEFIFLLDGDDRWAPGKLRRCMAAFDADEVLERQDVRIV